MKPIIFKIKIFLKLLGFSVPRKMLLQKHMKFPSEKYLFKNQRILPFENGFPKHMEYSSWKLPWKSPWNFHHRKWFSEKPMEFFSWKLLCKTYTIFIIKNNFKKNHGIFHLESKFHMKWNFLQLLKMVSLEKLASLKCIIWKQYFVFESPGIPHSFDILLLVHLYF